MARHVHTRGVVNLRLAQVRPLLLLALLAAIATVPTLRAQFADQSAAQVVAVEGNVSILKDDEPWALFAGQSVGTGQTILTGDDGFAELQVSDGSMFFVFPNSHVVFRRNPGSLRDLLDVFLGKVKVHIQKLGGNPNPNRIFTPTAVISVRGTTFDVEVDASETTVVIVDEGLVGVTHRLLPSFDELQIGAGESIVIYRDAPLAQARVDKVRAANVAGDMARTLAYIWNRIGRNNGAGPGVGAAAPVPGGGGGPLPGDTEAPEPPPPAP